MAAIPGVRPVAPSMIAEARTASTVMRVIVRGVKYTNQVIPSNAARIARSMT